METKGYEGSIVVGIDNSDYREPEMKPTWDEQYCLADRYSDFIINTVKKYVDTNYNTLTDRANTGIGGSSMGGLISFYMGLKHPEIFGYEVCFAPAFLFVSEEQIKDYMHIRIETQIICFLHIALVFKYLFSILGRTHSRGLSEHTEKMM